MTSTDDATFDPLRLFEVMTEIGTHSVMSHEISVFDGGLHLSRKVWVKPNENQSHYVTRTDAYYSKGSWISVRAKDAMVE